MAASPVPPTTELEGASAGGTAKFVLLAVVVVLAVQAVLAAIIYFSLPGSWEQRGQVGDMFGWANSLFSGLAFAGIIFTIHLQRQELALQRQELVLTRQEVAKQADATARLVELQETQQRFAQDETNASLPNFLRWKDNGGRGSPPTEVHVLNEGAPFTLRRVEIRKLTCVPNSPYGPVYPTAVCDVLVPASGTFAIARERGAGSIEDVLAPFVGRGWIHSAAKKLDNVDVVITFLDARQLFRVAVITLHSDGTVTQRYSIRPAGETAVHAFKREPYDPEAFDGLADLENWTQEPEEIRAVARASFQEQIAIRAARRADQKRE